MSSTQIEWAYALNQWPGVRREDHERCLKTVAACGFSGVELQIGSGRWAPLGRPELIDINFGSARQFIAFVRSFGLKGVSSFFYDPTAPSDEESTRGRSPSDVGEHAKILESARHFASFVAEVGGTQLVVRPTASYWQLAPVADAAIRRAAECWNAVGRMSAEFGVRTTMHVDCLSAAATSDGIAALLRDTDPACVGLAIDTGELAVAGLDAVQVFETHHDRVSHLQFKDAHAVDELGERTQPFAEDKFLSAGGSRGIERWFWEMGMPGGLVRFEALMGAIKRHGYRGWIVVESDQSPNPAESALLNSWYVQRVLSNR